MKLHFYDIDGARPVFLTEIEVPSGAAIPVQGDGVRIRHDNLSVTALVTSVTYQYNQGEDLQVIYATTTEGVIQ